MNLLEITKLLVKNGADPRIPTRSEYTAMHLLAKVIV
jgi:hypothetical protein